MRDVYKDLSASFLSWYKNISMSLSLILKMWGHIYRVVLARVRILSWFSCVASQATGNAFWSRPQSPQRLRWCQFYFHISSHKRAAYHIVHDFLLWGWVGICQTSGWGGDASAANPVPVEDRSLIFLPVQETVVQFVTLFYTYTGWLFHVILPCTDAGGNADRLLCKVIFLKVLHV